MFERYNFAEDRLIRNGVITTKRVLNRYVMSDQVMAGQIVLGQKHATYLWYSWLYHLVINMNAVAPRSREFLGLDGIGRSLQRVTFK